MNLCSRNSPYSLNCHVGATITYLQLVVRDAATINILWLQETIEIENIIVIC